MEGGGGSAVVVCGMLWSIEIIAYLVAPGLESRSCIEVLGMLCQYSKCSPSRDRE